jgi:hypothetical protein
MQSRCVHQRSVTSHRSQVSTEDLFRKGFYQALASLHSNHFESTCDGIEQTHRHAECETCLLTSPSTTVSASPGRAGRCASRGPSPRRRISSSLQKWQFPGSGASIRPG